MIGTLAMASETALARKHVEEIRRTKFSIGGQPNLLTEDLHQAVKILSAELYAKDVHFLMELIQNAEDNEYPADVVPSLEFVITSKDITNTGAPATLVVFNNEKGFLRKNIESICSVGGSTKKAMRQHGYIGEKGIGFKSVFLITSQPYIFSNGYQIRFNEKPCHHCNVGYIVPEWVNEDNAMLSAIQSVYGSSSTDLLPTTTLVLPLKPEKVKPVKDQLSSVHPEVLLFSAKIRRLSVREDNEDPKLNTVTAISISSEENFFTSKSLAADSYTLHLTAGGVGESECAGYYMWKQRFPVKQENKVDMRREVEEWVITLAFPHGERLKRGGMQSSSPPGIYSFLPTETVTNFPFIIQADFLLASSRENILWDNKWNKGILDCVHVAFVNAFKALLKSTEDAPVSSLPNMFLFLPVNTSSYIKLNDVRDAIKAKLMNEMIVPCESYNTAPPPPQKKKLLFCKPKKVRRLLPTFWNIWNEAKKQGVSFSEMSSHGAYQLIASSLGRSEYNGILNFLGIKFVDIKWYEKCIERSNLVYGVSEDVYIQLLVFIAENWGSYYSKTALKHAPLIKYVSGPRKLLAADSDNSISWLIDWNTHFGGLTYSLSLPKVTQEAILSCARKPMLVNWFKECEKVNFVSVYDYAAQILHNSVNIDPKLAVAYAHILYTSLKKDYLMEHQIKDLCSKMPIVDNYGEVKKRASMVVVPAKGSRWLELIGSYHWGQHNYIELSEDYTRCATYFGNVIPGEELISFLTTYVKASDVPYLSPPDAAIPTLSSPITKNNSFLLLDWLRFLRASEISLPEKFFSSIKNGSWLKILLGSSCGYRPPSESFFLDSSIRNLLQNGSLLVEIPLIDKKFYGEEINDYKDELRTIGVKFENAEACEYIGNRLMSLAASSELTRDNVILILKFIKYLGANSISPGEFIKSIKGKKWVKTSRGHMTPNNSVLFSHEWTAASQISDIPFIDESYYGNELLSFKEELELLGVAVRFNQSVHQLVVDNVKSSSSLASLSSEAMLLTLTCIKNLESSNKLVQAMKNTKCLKTNLDYTRPSECILMNPKSPWGGLLQVFGSFSFLDEKFYEKSIFSMSDELKKIGVMVDFEDVCKEFTRTFKQQASLSSIKKEHVISFLQCYRKLKKLDIKFSDDFQNCIRKEKWIQTRLGDYRSPDECILFGTDWKLLSPIYQLPFIDDNFYGNVIHTYRVELKELGVVTDFKDGAKFVANGLFLLQDSSSLTPESVHDNNNLFGEQMNVLENCKYDDEIPGFFAKTFNMKVHPSVNDYCKLWKTWEASGRHITHEECCAFWEFVVGNWYPRKENIFKNNLSKLPVLDPNSNEIILVDKNDIFIGDDLFLTGLFQSCCRPIFVWFPQPSLKSLTRTKLVDIYTKLGVRTLSESAQKNISDVDHAGFECVNSKEKIIKKGLLKLILGFLADPKLEIEPDKRHEAVSCLLALEAVETREKMIIRYRLSLSSGDVVEVESRRMVRWDKQSSKLFMKKMERSSVHKNVMEYAFHFAEEIAEGMLWENEELVLELSELIRSCFLVDFGEEAVEFFMKKKNLQIFVEDQDYLSSIFSSPKGNLQKISWADPSPSPGKQPTPRLNKRRVHHDNSVTSYSSSYGLRSTKIWKKKRRVHNDNPF